MFFACCTSPSDDLMTERHRFFWQQGMVLAALLLAAALPAGAFAASEAAPSVSWNVTFSPENNNKFDAVAPTADGGYIALGSALTEVYGGKEDLLLVKTDGNGTHVWNRTFPDIAPASVTKTADGGYIIGAYNVSTTGSDQNITYQGSSFLIRTDDAGTEKWRQVLSGMMVSSVAETPDGGYAVIGWLWSRSESIDDTAAAIVKTDGNGTPVWNRTFPGTAANAGLVTADGGYVIGGTKSPFNNDRGDAFLIRLDADGSTLWHENYGAPTIYDIKEADDGRFVYAGNYWYGLVDANGEEIWLKNMEGLTGYAVGLRPSGGYLIAGTDQRSSEGFAFGTDGDGAIQWNTTFPATGVYAAGNAPDGGYVLAGIRFLSPDTSAAWLVGLEEPAEPAPTTPGFGAAVAGTALLLLVAERKMRR